MECLCYGMYPQTDVKGDSFLSNFISGVECVLASTTEHSLREEKETQISYLLLLI